MIVALADEIVEEREAAGQKVVFPGGKTVDDASTQADYPPDIWQAAAQKWAKVPAEEKASQIEQMKAFRQVLVAQMGGQARGEVFAASFGIFDALWFFLAAATAYKLGAGNVSSDE